MKHNSKETLATRLFISLGIVVGVIAIVFGILVLTADPDRYAVGISNNVYFGSQDSYNTYSYNAAKITANNLEAVFDTLRFVQQAFGYLLISVGLLVIVIFAIKFVNNFNSNVQAATANNIGETQNELATLKQLYEAGAISEQEYENKKKEILGI